MCRLFGFRSRMPASASRWLLDSSNSLAHLSHEHSDGWGVGHYAAGVPVLTKGIAAAHLDPEYAEASRRAVSTCTLGHIRRISVGALSLENCHPFAHRGWLFAHNGTVVQFDELRAPLEGLIDPALRPNLRGTTDSERCFHLFLTHLDAASREPAARLEQIASALARTVADVRALPGSEAGGEHALTFLVTDGEHLVGLRSGAKELWYSTHRRGEPEPADPGYFVLASEPLDDVEDWRALDDGWTVGVGAALRPRMQSLDALRAARAAQ